MVYAFGSRPHLSHSLVTSQANKATFELCLPTVEGPHLSLASCATFELLSCLTLRCATSEPPLVYKHFNRATFELRISFLATFESPNCYTDLNKATFERYSPFLMATERSHFFRTFFLSNFRVGDLH